MGLVREERNSKLKVFVEQLSRKKFCPRPRLRTGGGGREALLLTGSPTRSVTVLFGAETRRQAYF